MKKKIVIILLIILSISLCFNIYVLIKKINNDNQIKKENKEINEQIGKDENGINIKYSKEEIGKLFKDYQAQSKLAESDNLAIFEVTKVTYVGHFKSNKNKKLYYFDEKYSCVEGIECVKTFGKVTADDKLNNFTTFVVAVTPIDKNNALFEILDYSIEDNKDFIKEKHVELK